MQPRELVPLVLLTAVVAFVAGERSRPPRGNAAPVPAANPTAPIVTLQGAPDSTSVAAPPAAPAGPPRDDQLIRAQLRDGAPGTYIDAMMQDDENRLTRWPDRRLNALRIWIEREPAVSNWDPQYYAAAARAFEEWRLAGFPVALDVLAENNNTDIRIYWRDQFPPADGDQIGVTDRRRDQNGWLVAAEISIATHDKDGVPIPAENIFGVARHEIGHALGMGHSNNPNDVMFPYSRATVISRADRATLNLLYRLPPGVVK